MDKKILELHQAVASGNIEVVQNLLSQNVNVNAKKDDESGFTVFHVAALRNNKAMLELLVKAANADLSIKSSKGKTALQYALDRDYLQSSKILIQAGSNVNDKNFYNRTALHLSVKKNDSELVEHLLLQGAEVDAKDQCGCTPLSDAVSHNNNGSHLSLIVKLLEKNADPNSKDSWEKTPLHIAAERGDAQTIEILVSYKVDVNVKGVRGMKGIKDFTPLHLAASENEGQSHFGAIEMLLKNNADPNKKDRRGQTVLHIAAEQGNAQIIEILVSYKADVNVADDNDCTPLHLAASKNIGESHFDAIETLLKNNADFLTVDKTGKLPFQVYDSRLTDLFSKYNQKNKASKND